MAFDQKRHDELAARMDKDANDLDAAEAEELALLRSEVSLNDYDPSKITNESDRVVELGDHASTTLGELAADESKPVSLRIDAQSAIDNPPSSSPVAQEQMKAQVAESAPGASGPTADGTGKDSPKPAPSSTSSTTASGSGSSSTSTS